MHVHEALHDKQFDFEDSSTVQLNMNNNESTPRNKHKEQAGIRGQHHRCSECEEVYASSAELGLHMLHHDADYPGSVLNHCNATSKKPGQVADHLGDSTESGSGESN